MVFPKQHVGPARVHSRLRLLDAFPFVVLLRSHREPSVQNSSPAHQEYRPSSPTPDGRASRLRRWSSGAGIAVLKENGACLP